APVGVPPRKRRFGHAAEFGMTSFPASRYSVGYCTPVESRTLTMKPGNASRPKIPPGVKLEERLAETKSGAPADVTSTPVRALTRVSSDPVPGVVTTASAGPATSTPAGSVDFQRSGAAAE